MIQLFRLPPSSIITSCTIPSKCFEGTHIFFQKQKSLQNTRINYSSHKPAVYKARLPKTRKTNSKKNVKQTELLKVTQSQTTQTTMQIGKLSASHITAFAEEPGMILKNTKNLKSTKESGQFKFVASGKTNTGFHRPVRSIENAKPENSSEIHKNKIKNMNTIIKPAIVSESKQQDDQEKLHVDSESFSHAIHLKNIDKTIEIGNILANENYENEFLAENISPDFEDNASDDLKTILNYNHSDMANEYYNQMLASYIDVCVSTGMLEEACAVLDTKKAQHLHPEVYNIAIRGCSALGNWKMLEKVMKQMKSNNVPHTCQTYALYLNCLADVSNQVNGQKIYTILTKLKTEGIQLNDLFTKTNLSFQERENVLRVIRHIIPDFDIAPHRVNLHSTCPLTADIFKDNSRVIPPLPAFTDSQLQDAVKQQLCMEKEMSVTVESILKNENDSHNPYRVLWEELNAYWKKKLHKAFVIHLNVLKIKSSKMEKHLNIYPYLKCLPVETYVDIMLSEIQSLALTSESYSPKTASLYSKLGQRICYRYAVSKKADCAEDFERISDVIQSYCTWFAERNGPARNTRQKWQLLAADNPDVLSLNEKPVLWPFRVVYDIGNFLYKLIFKCAAIPSDMLKKKNGRKLTPAFYLVLRYRNSEACEEVKFHPELGQLCRRANVNKLNFDVNQLPMICPPKPWCGVYTGGYHLVHTHFVRPTAFNVNMRELSSIPSENLYVIFDALNQLQSVPWMVNEKVLDIAISVFKNGGSKALNVPTKPLDTVPTIGNTVKNFDSHRQRMKELQDRKDEYGLWCEGLYKLSLANHYRHKIFWLPQNIDFRGRVYPVPPHVNHITGDLYRSLLLFARKECLGEKGLDWLKLHAINLTGTHKKKSIAARLEYANEVLPDILDSAENPLTGKMWWAKSEEPWQTLATCIEIRNALQCDNPKGYRSGLPIHQDGSCNGLQHYAAIGRDEFGGSSVNLCPSDVPQDVYSVVTGIIEASRKDDAEKGLEIAKVLEGFVTRKVVKQTVMTTVYGVTMYGARLQIAGRLEDIPEFPKDRINEASLYLTCKIFKGLQKMFTSAKQIQDWFIQCSRIICRDYQDSVSWITPLGLPVTQPYFKLGRNKNLVPDTRKQGNAFPPNFIHSLDSSHMMLTALNCEQAGITFASVHDCFWTHPCSVEVMNRICREKFIALHSEDILHDLSKHFHRRYKNNKISLDPSKQRSGVFSDVPKTGQLDLNIILQSVYFFS